MKKILNTAFVTFVAIFLVSVNSFGQEPARPAAAPEARQQARAPRIVSPEIHADNSVTFRINARDASRVTISGEWQEGPGSVQEMVKNDAGVFSLTVGPLSPELYGYTFALDGVGTIDPANVQVRRDGARYQSFLIVPGPESDLYFHKHGVPHGTVSKVWYNSPVLKMDRRAYVYTPAGYEGGTQKYPVFYLLHGAGGDEDAWTNMGHTAQIMDNLIAQGRAEPMIVVMTNGNANQAGAQNEVPPVPAEGEQGMAAYQRMAGRFEEHLVKDLMPWTEKHYRTLNGIENRAIAGLSMGGMHTQTITNNNPGVFGYIGVFSMGIMTRAGQTQDAAKAAAELNTKLEALKNSGYKLYWIACGKDDFVYKGVVTLRETLDKINFKYVYRESTGGHTWANWRIYLSEFAPMLFK
ncbi:MAG TPA: alpha/beta hydrolase-fold protein [Bacteroidales bacterium]|nr:alpha/beta hydrolase-fold protein [Bacteroidales bacterium]